jgi:AmiR/NasT family two-component response regulator
VGEAISKVSQARGIPKPLFLLLTGWSGQALQKEKIVKSGVDAIVEKPVDIPQLLSIVGKLMERRRESDSLLRHES